MAVRDLGNPLGNPLARARSGGVLKFIGHTRVAVAGSGVAAPIAGAVYMRVTVVGAGGGGDPFPVGGGGGGCATSGIVPAVSVPNTIGAGVSGNDGVGQGGTSTATAGKYVLSATGGQVGVAGIGSGGLYNTRGGVGDGSGAGGGGGPGGDGGASNNFGAYTLNNGMPAGGDGSISAAAAGTAASRVGNPTTPMWGEAQSAGVGGKFGGGGWNGSAGGVGGLVVEWFAVE